MFTYTEGAKQKDIKFFETFNKMGKVEVIRFFSNQENVREFINAGARLMSNETGFLSLSVINKSMYNMVRDTGSVNPIITGESPMVITHSPTSNVFEFTPSFTYLPRGVIATTTAYYDGKLQIRSLISNIMSMYTPSVSCVSALPKHPMKIKFELKIEDDNEGEQVQPEPVVQTDSEMLSCAINELIKHKTELNKKLQEKVEQQIKEKTAELDKLNKKLCNLKTESVNISTEVHNKLMHAIKTFSSF